MSGPGTTADHFASELGARVITDRDEKVVVVLDAERRHCNDLGRVHGGALFSLADVALSVISNQTATVSVATAASVQFFASAGPGERLVAVAQPEHRGRRIGVYAVRITVGSRRVAVFTGQTVAIGERGGDPAAAEAMDAPLRRAEQTAREHLAVACGDERFTYAQLADRCRRLAGALYGLGLERGDRVAVVGPNCHRYLELYMGVPSSGLVIVPLNARHTDNELRYALDDAGVRVLFAARRPESLPDCVEHVFDLGHDYERLVATGEERDLSVHDPDALAGLFYTGGTTGASKGVMLTHANLMANARHFMACWRFGPDTRWLVAAPMFHAAGTIGVLATIWTGGTHFVMPGFDAAAALDLIEANRITHTLLVPTMLAAIADEQLTRPRDVSSLGFISHGGSPVATETLRRAATAFPDAELLHIYGATETAPIVTLMPREERLLDSPRARSCGQAAVGVDVAVLSQDGTSLPPGEVGEVAVRGPNVMAGYWKKDRETAAALRDGWYVSGDLGYLDDDGFLFLVDRAKDMIVTGGENVYSTEVEDALYVHEAVLEAAVFAVPHERWGEAVHAVVVPRTDVTREELIDHCRELIADYKIPKTIEIRADPLPKSGAGKILKRELREPHWQSHRERVGGG